MGRSQHPFRESVVEHRPSRHAGLDVSVFAPKHGPTFRAYVHTPSWDRVLAVSAADAADTAMGRAEALLTQAVGQGVDVKLPTAVRALGLQSSQAAAAI
jgi:hypothetical protein